MREREREREPTPMAFISTSHTQEGTIAGVAGEHDLKDRLSIVQEAGARAMDFLGVALSEFMQLDFDSLLY